MDTAILSSSKVVPFGAWIDHLPASMALGMGYSRETEAVFALKVQERELNSQ